MNSVNPNPEHVVGIIKPRRMLRTVVSLTVICLCVALLLSVVNALTADKIAENLKGIEKEAIIEVFGNENIEYTLLENIPDTVSAVYTVTLDGSPLGWCVTVSPSGFGGNIDMVVGVSPDGNIAGVAITALSETPGLGSRVADRNYLAAYTGLGTALKLNADVDAITGATISSRSVLSGVNTATGALVTMGLINAAGGQ